MQEQAWELHEYVQPVSGDRGSQWFGAGFGEFIFYDPPCDLLACVRCARFTAWRAR